MKGKSQSEGYLKLAAILHWVQVGVSAHQQPPARNERA
jgi:hypothetical protein